MKKFIIKTSFFVAPFLFLYLLNVLFYEKEEGDLIRLGYLYDNPTPLSETLQKVKVLPKKYQLISEIDLDKNHQFDLLSIGDSFSEQGEFGYQNQLANKGISVLHIDRFLSEESPIQNLTNLINSDFFDKIKPKYVVLQTVERAIPIRANVVYNEQRTLDSLKTQIRERVKPETPPSGTQFFSKATLKIPLANLQFLFLNQPPFSYVYRFKSNNRELFSNEPNTLLFFRDDFKTIPSKNDPKMAKQLNDNINRINQLLKEKGIKLIFIISPDKYDLYQEYVENSKEKSIFFSLFHPLKKDYIYIPSFEILSEAIKNQKDIYFYDDTHWSPKAAEIISNEIYKHIQKEKQTAQ